jgi:hypothetical protein
MRGVCTRQPISYQSQLILRIRRSDQHPYYRLNWRNVSFAFFHHVIVIERVFLMRASKFSIAHAYKYNERRLLFIPNQCKNSMMHRIVFSAVDVFLLCNYANSTDSKGVDRIVVFAESIDSDSWLVVWYRHRVTEI